MALEAGTKLGPYEILSPLGAGGMGEVYRAKDTTLHREVAIKVLPADVASSPERLLRFEREATTVAALNHPNIVTIFGIEESDGHRFIAMELVEGETLDRLIAPGGMPLAKLFDIAIPLSDALAAAHDRGIVHRDLKPANVMVTKEGRVKVLDFGLAKLTATRQGGSSPDDVTLSAPLTGRGMIIGTVPYMSPEQLKSKPIDHRSDIFSLGIMLYEMASGGRPFTGDDSATVMSAILRDTPRPVQELNSILPRHLGRIVARCLKKNPEERYQTAKDVLNELRELRKEVDSGSDVSESQFFSAPPSDSSPSSSPSSTTLSGSALSAPTRRGEFWIGVGVLAVVILLVGLWIGQDGRVSDEITTINASSNTTPPIHAKAGIMPDSQKDFEPKISLAILPFKDNSPKPQDWLASGLADAISTRLGRLSASKLGVLGPETTTFYAQPGKSIQDLVEALNVDFVLRGSIQIIDKAVRISANLIRADDFTSSWSDEFNGSLDDPFSLQSMVAEKIIGGLPFELSGEETVQLKKRYTAKPKAELAYMQGRFLSPGGGGVERMTRAVSYFERAIEIDVEYALAYCGLVQVKCSLATWGALPTLEIREEMKEAVARALALDDSLSEVHVSSGVVAQYLHWDWAAAEAAFKRAIELDPNDDNSRSELAYLLPFVGRYDEAIEQFEQSINLNPVSSSHLSGLGMLYAGIGRLTEAESLLQRALEFDENFLDASIWLADVRQKQGRYDDAVKIMERLVFSVDDRDISLRCYLGNAYAMAGRMEDARKQLVEMQRLAKEVPAPHMFFAEMHAALGEKDEAFRRLDQAFEEREAWLPHLRFEPGLIHIRNDPRFAELHRKMGLGHVDLSYASKLVPTMSEQKKKTMLAVLPFANLSGDPEQEYFSDGMTEEMITRLGRLRPELLGVIARTSAMRYKNTDKLIDQIGRELGVSYVIEGGVRRAGSSVRINAQLIQVSDQTQLWGDSYTRDLSDVFAVQEEVAEAIAEALAVELLPEQQIARSKAPPESSAAYDAYLLGRSYWAKRTPASLHTAIKHFKHAIELDPNYALAYCGLADTWSVMPYYVPGAYNKINAEAMKAAGRALALNDSLAEAHVSMANVLADGGDLETANEHFQKAVAIDPNNATAHQWYGYTLTIQERYDRAAEEYEKAIALDPLSAVIHNEYGHGSVLARRFDKAIEQLNEALRLQSDFKVAYVSLTWAYIGKEDHNAATKAFESFLRITNRPTESIKAFRRTCDATGLRAGFLEWLDSLGNDFDSWGAGPARRAPFYAWCNEKDRAFESLDRAIKRGSPLLNIVATYFPYDNLRDDPRYADLLERIAAKSRTEEVQPQP